MIARVKGIESVRKEMRARLQEIAGSKTESAVYAVLSQGAALADTMTPIEIGFLINSRYSPVIWPGREKISGRVGYIAEYAPYVHDAPGTMAGILRASGRGEYWDPGGEPGFLAKGFEQVMPAVPQILKSVYGA